MNLEDSFSFVFRSFTLVLPIFCAGLILILSLQRNYLSWLNKPIDGGKSIGGKRVFGDNKTWRGICIYFVGTTIVCILLWVFYAHFPKLIHPIYSFNPIFIGMVFSMSYVAGELANSFVKRRRGILPGVDSGSRTQGIIDNVDGIVFVIIALFIVLNVSIGYLAVAGIIGVILHTCTDVVMMRLRLK